MINNNFDGLTRGPRIISQIREDMQTDQNTPVLERVKKILEEEKYRLSPKQKRILVQSSISFDQHRKARQEAKEMDEPELKKRLAQSLQCNVEDIANVTFHEASVTASLKNSAFQKEWQRTCEYEGVGVDEVVYPEGLASERFNTQIANGVLPVSIENIVFKKDGEISRHENLHTQYRYLHPQNNAGEILKPTEYRSQLTKRSKELYQGGDQEEFIKLVRGITEDQLSIYLNELSSVALEKGTGILSQAFGDNNHLYNVVYRKKIQAIRQSLPPDLKERLAWERIIYEEMEKAKLRARYIDTEYKKLAKTDINGNELVALVEFLTPDQGFLIKAFTGEELNLSNVKKWKKEYDHPEMKDKQGKIEYDANFFLDVAGISEKEYETIKKSISGIISAKTKDVFLNIGSSAIKREDPQSKDNNWLDDLEIQIQNMKRICVSRTERLLPLFTSGYLDEDGIAQNKEAIVAEAMRRSVDFNYHFLQSVSEVIGLKIGGNSGSDYMRDRELIFKRSFSLDDAAEDLAEALNQKKQPDYNDLFSKNYKKDDIKRERMRKRLCNLGLPELDDSFQDQSPLEDASVALFSKIMNTVSGERPELIAGEKQLQLLCSSCIRVLLWGKEHADIPQMKFGAIKMFIDDMYRIRALPMEYNDLVKDGSLGIDIDLKNEEIGYAAEKTG